MKMETVPLADLGKIVSGSTPRTNVSDFWNGDIPWITPADLSSHDGVYYKGSPKMITKKGFESCSTTMLPSGAILFSSRAPIGHCAVAKYPVCTNQGFKNIIPNEKLDSIYGFFALKYLTSSIQAKGHGATFAEVTKEMMEEVEFPYCDIAAQKKIAEKLAQADRLRRLRLYALETSESFLPAVFIEMFGDPVRNIHEYPAEFLGNLGDVTTGGTPSSVKSGMFGGKIPFITPGDLEVDTQHSHRFLTDAGVKESVSVRAGSALVCCIGTIGKTDKARVRCSFNQQINAVEWDKNINDDFGFYLMRFFSRVIADRGRSTTLPILKKSAFEELILPVPPMLFQQKFSDIVKRHERLHSSQGESLRQAEHLFQSLLHQAFSEN